MRLNYSKCAVFSALLAGLALPLQLGAQVDNSLNQLQVSSNTFADYSIMPLSTINNIVMNGVNTCSINGATGGDESPELSWTPVPGARSYTVVLFDVTASFTHWGMYNIPATTTRLPQNAGVAGSTYGTQVVNDFGTAMAYGGPCPPAGYAPYVHEYVFTVYALNELLTLQASPPNFPANAESLYHALIKAGMYGHILQTGSYTGFYSTTK